MAEQLQRVLREAALLLLRPLARVLLKHGMSHGTFSELSREAFVCAGFDHMENSGRRPSISGVASLTGLSRKEVKRLRENSPTQDQETSRRYNRAVRVLTGWYSDERFQTAAGQPAVLSLDDTGISFASLIKEYGGDVTPKAMLSLLQASHNIERQENQVSLISHVYLPMFTPIEKLTILGTDVSELVSTIEHNLEPDCEERWFQRKVSNLAIRNDALANFKELSNKKSQALLEEYDSWLSNHEQDEQRTEDGPGSYVAVGIYYIEREN